MFSLVSAGRLFFAHSALFTSRCFPSVAFQALLSNGWLVRACYPSTLHLQLTAANSANTSPSGTAPRFAHAPWSLRRQSARVVAAPLTASTRSGQVHSRRTSAPVRGEGGQYRECRSARSALDYKLQVSCPTEADLDRLVRNQQQHNLLRATHLQTAPGCTGRAPTWGTLWQRGSGEDPGARFSTSATHKAHLAKQD